MRLLPNQKEPIAKNINKKVINKFEEYAKQNPKIAFFAKCVGGWDIEYTLYLQNNNQLRDLIFDIKKEFSNNIKKLETLNLFRTKKYSFSPKEL